MLKPLKIMKVSQMPAQPEPDAIYFARLGNSNNFRMYITPSAGAAGARSALTSSDMVSMDHGTSKFYGNAGTTPTVRDNVNLVRTVTTNGSLITFVLTENGLTTGVPIFSDLNLCRIHPTTVLASTSTTTTNWCTIHSINTNTNTVVIRVMRDRSFNNQTTTVRLHVSGPGFVE